MDRLAGARHEGFSFVPWVLFTFYMMLEAVLSSCCRFHEWIMLETEVLIVWMNGWSRG